MGHGVVSVVGPGGREVHDHRGGRGHVLHEAHSRTEW